MKRILFIAALALTMVACGQKDNTNQEQPEERKVVIPPGMPVAPTPQAPVMLENNPSSNGPTLTMEEGKPLDFSQLMGERESLGEQAAEKIDTIRYQAEQGNPDYECLYATCLENGWGVEADISQALKWYKKAADHQQKTSFNSLGNLYRMGNGVKQDIQEAFRWYQKGAEAGDAQAMLNVGNCYYYGMGAEKDLAKAVKWWKDAADNENAYAMAQMGDCYYSGIGVGQDLAKAVEYLTQAVGKNVSSAQYRLGLMYYNGEGVDQDRAYSKMLMSKARDAGMKEAQDFLDRNF